MRQNNNNDAGGVYNIADVDKETYIKSKITLANADGSFELDNVGSGFKGRGNGSWMQDNNKNGYKLKFDKKQSLFGREANKHWVILACTNFSDPTLLRNFTAYEMASEVLDGIEYVTSVEWIDVYINGDYRGVYVLCKHVRVGKGRVNIKSEYGVLDTGYLIEYDAYADGIEGVDYFSIADSADEATQVSALLAPGGDNPDSKGDNPGGDNPGGETGDDSKGGGDDSKGGGGSNVEQQQAESNWVENCKILKKWFDDRIDFLNEEWK